MNKRKKAGTSRSKKNSTISPKAYANMKKGFPKKKKMKVYTKAGKEFKGSHHKMPNGQIHSGKKTY